MSFSSFLFSFVAQVFHFILFFSFFNHECLSSSLFPFVSHLSRRLSSVCLCLCVFILLFYQSSFRSLFIHGCFFIFTVASFLSPFLSCCPSTSVFYLPSSIIYPLMSPLLSSSSSFFRFTHLSLCLSACIRSRFFFFFFF